MENFTVELGKYTYEYNGGKQAVFRDGELWREETGDNFILTMAMRINELEDEVDGLREERESLMYEIRETAKRCSGDW